MKEFDVKITPANGWFQLNLKDIWKYRDLILLFVRRNFISLYKQTILGPAWAVIQPLITTVFFTIIFGNLAGLAAKGTPPFIFYLSGTIAWGYFAGCLTQTAGTFTNNAGIFGKVYFPRLVMPISAVLTNLISFAIQFGMFLVFYLPYLWKGAVQPSWFILLIPLMIVHMAMLGLGCGIIISALTTKYRDLVFVVNFGVQLWMYGTPVAYDVSIIPQKYLWLYSLNPMTPIINTFRHAFLNIGTFSVSQYLMSWTVTLAMLLLGIVLFSRVEKNFMDTI